jgi:hypothetical protein
MDIRFKGVGDGWKMLAPLIESESCFRVSYPKGKELTVAFHKGTWYFTVRKGLEMSKTLQMSDAPEVYEDEKEEEPLAYALLQSFIDRALTEHKGDYAYNRPVCAEILCRFFSIWAGDEPESVEVLQWGRNSFIDEGGVLSLSPEVNKV